MKRIEFYLVILSLIAYTLLTLAKPYGDSRTLNQGWYIGKSDTCQVGYETRGTTGFFAYCNK